MGWVTAYGRHSTCVRRANHSEPYVVLAGPGMGVHSFGWCRRVFVVDAALRSQCASHFGALDQYKIPELRRAQVEGSHARPLSISRKQNAARDLG